MTEPSTQHRYRLVWKRFIAFVIRAYFLPEASRKQVSLILKTYDHTQYLFVYRGFISSTFLDKFDRPYQSSPCDGLKITYYSIPLHSASKAKAMLQCLLG